MTCFSDSHTTDVQQRTTVDPVRRSLARRVTHRARRILAGLREFNAEQIELHERVWLLNRPWEEEYLHWADDGLHDQLHGHLVPPDDHRRHSVTRGGWCVGHRSVPLR